MKLRCSGQMSLCVAGGLAFVWAGKTLLII